MISCFGGGGGFLYNLCNMFISILISVLNDRKKQEHLFSYTEAQL